MLALILLKHGQFDVIEVYLEKDSWHMTFSFTTLLDQNREKQTGSASCHFTMFNMLPYKFILKSERECKVREYAAEEQWMLMEAESCEICVISLKGFFRFFGFRIELFLFSLSLESYFY